MLVSIYRKRITFGRKKIIDFDKKKFNLLTIYYSFKNLILVAFLFEYFSLIQQKKDWDVYINKI